ncbi:unnamed protein product [Polarella glacialis]|uniref:C3H1-type domain-containing protein n=1 Tax=Polarella glacialis TaxID=89957 RepID=A0A813K6C1_POLGL|nr:unnamed protein product [Polarella glacialis]
MEAHRLGVCVPCNYFACKADGCRNGDECTWCHFCSVDTAKSRRRQIRAEAKQSSKANAQARKQFGNYQAEFKKELGPSRISAILGLQFQPSKLKNTSVHFSDVNEAPKGLSRGGSVPILMSAMTEPAMPAECMDAFAVEDDASVPGEESHQEGSCLSSNNNSNNNNQNNNDNKSNTNNINNNKQNNSNSNNNNMPLTAQMEAHRLGLCEPCIYFACKPGGCRKGDECNWCHFCDVDTAKSRRRQLRAEAKQSKATSQARKQLGNNQVEVQKVLGMFLSATD